jgi:hypothetical protein
VLQLCASAQAATAVPGVQAAPATAVPGVQAAAPATAAALIGMVGCRSGQRPAVAATRRYPRERFPRAMTIPAAPRLFPTSKITGRGAYCLSVREPRWCVAEHRSR